jgi:hypothetical protein
LDCATRTVTLPEPGHDFMRLSPFRRLLAWSVTASLLLPIALTLVLGLGSLLAALGDAAAATACGRLTLALGVAWLTAVVATTVASGLMTLGNAERDERRRSMRRPWQRHRARRDRRMARPEAERMRDRGFPESGEPFGGES